MTIRLLVILTLCHSFAAADTILLRDGSKLEGSVVKEEGDNYILRVKVSDSIYDEMKIAKEDVIDISKKKEDKAEWEKIQKSLPTPDLMEVSEYEELIRKTEAFLKAHPNSKYADEAEKALSMLKNEKEIIASGGVKYDGVVVPSEERMSNIYALDSQMAAKEFNKLASSGRPIEALRVWDKLEEDFSNSQAYVENIPLALSLMENLQRQVTRLLDSYDERMKQREEDFKLLPAKDQQRVQRAIEQKSANYLSMVEEQRANKVEWISLDPDHENELKDIENKLKKAISKAERAKTTASPSADQAWRDAYKVVISDAELRDKKSAISRARSAKLPKEYVEMLEEMLE